MSQIQFLLKSADKKRLIKDRLMRYAITAGGGSVFGALILIFFYLAWIGLPLFSAAEIKLDAPVLQIKSVPDVPVFMSVGKKGRHVFTLSQQGEMTFWSRSQHEPPVLSEQLHLSSSLYTQSSDRNWFASLGKDQSLMIGKPLFTYRFIDGAERFEPAVGWFDVPAELQKKIPPDVTKFSFSVDHHRLTAAFLSASQGLIIVSNDPSITQGERISILPGLSSADDIIVKPGGRIVYLRQGNELIIVSQQQNSYTVREVVDLSNGKAADQALHLNLLAGGESLIVRHQDGMISQWFDVVSHNQRHFTRIREFNVGKQTQYLLPDSYHKGFFSFGADGTVANYYATTQKEVLSEKLYHTAPELAALSVNEKHLVTYHQGALRFASVDLKFPEISFSALWQKVWYENYPAPDYVWQSTAVSDTFEPKFSLVPIIFGTVKAAFYAMLLAVPVAIFAAVYTAYFMSPSMRRKVKPTIELMEALPTVIIGFLAGLWLAPIVERHLVSVIMMVVLLPVLAFICGMVWYYSPQKWFRRIDKGWHAVLLIPIFIIGMILIYYLSFDLESWLFQGDIRVFLVQYGMGFDQRNALVVGLAMGFAVIPTIFTIAEDAVFSVPAHLSDGSLALGATRWQTLIHVVLFTASPGIFSAMMIGIGRAVGETMIVLMATGNTPIKNWNIFEGMRTLAATIAVELPESEVGSSQYRLLFLAALILFVFTFFVNSLAEWVRLRLREKYRAM